jgi:transposase
LVRMIIWSMFIGFQVEVNIVKVVTSSSNCSGSKKSRSLREKSGKPSGGQKGHPGSTLEMADLPDDVVVHRAGDCCNCGQSLCEVPVFSSIRRQVCEGLRLSDVLHADETPVNVNGRQNYLYVFSNEKMTYYFAGSSRAKKTMDLAGILGGYSGTLVSDCYAPYFSYDCANAVCNVHILRDLKGIIDLEPDKPPWVEEFRDFLVGLKKRTDERRAKSLPYDQDELEKISCEYDGILKRGMQSYGVVDKGKKWSRPGSLVLLNRLVKRKSNILAFAYNFDVPFDNNLAERDLRMCKVKQKISGVFRSFEGLRIFSILRTYISTLKKNGINIFKALISLAQGNNLMPQIIATT